MNEIQLKDRIGARVLTVRERLGQACHRCGRSPDSVRLVAVTKTVSPQIAAILVELGQIDLGENRPQELWRKAAELPANVHWHLIGHLQRNKIERTLPLVYCFHAVDSSRLLDALEAEAAKLGRRLPVLLEVNASRESAKQGWRPEDVPALADHLAKLSSLEVRGLMTMAAFEENPENCRPTFRETRQVLEELAVRVGSAHPLNQLSMGMSNDFEIAVEEGATLVRLGSVLFEGIEDETK